MTAIRSGLIISLTAATLMTGCSNLPRGAALQSEIVKDAGQTDPGFAFYPVTRALLPTLAEWPSVNAEVSSGWPATHHGSLGQVVSPGDMVDVTIWDSDDNSLLATPGQRVVPLGEMQVSPSGRIFIPYVGDVRISGLNPDRARALVQRRVEAISPSAQVQLMMAAGRQNTVDLVSGVSQPGSYPLPDGNFSVLGLLSQGGGIPLDLRNPRVKIQRGHHTYASSVSRLYQDPRLDAVLTGGDKVIVEEDKRYFLSVGAAGKEDIIYFPQDYVTALEAISLIGGITDTRADPRGILVLREYPRSALAAGQRGPRGERVVFAIDMTTADGLFSAKTMAIEPGDVVLATESPVTKVSTALGIVGTAFGILSTASRVGE